MPRVWYFWTTALLLLLPLLINAMSKPAPLYITVGPPCAGKTTLLLQKGVQASIALDDQPDVYVPIPQRVFVGYDEEELLDRVYYGASVRERLIDQKELQTVLCRLEGSLSAEDCRAVISDPLLLEGIDQILRRRQEDAAAVVLPPNIDLYISHAIFRAHPDTNESGLDAAQRLVRQAPLDQPVAWGNTNTQCRDYQDMLGLASHQGRPVRFLVHQPQSIDVSNTIQWDMQADLPELMVRNLHRLLETGRYIPVDALRRMCDKSEQLIQSVHDDWSRYQHPRQGGWTRQDLERGLCLMAGYQMRSDGTVYPLPGPRRPHYNANRGSSQPPPQDRRRPGERPWDRKRQPRPPSQWDESPNKRPRPPPQR